MLSVILILLPIIALLVGLFLLLRPQESLEIQRIFYQRINWRIEPISIKREIRNTKAMGLFLICLSIVTVTYIIIDTFK